MVKNAIGTTFTLKRNSYIVLDEGFTVTNLHDYQYYISAANTQKKEYVWISFGPLNRADNLIGQDGITLEYEWIFKFYFTDKRPRSTYSDNVRISDPVKKTLIEKVGLNEILKMISSLDPDEERLLYRRTKILTETLISDIWLKGRQYFLNYRTDLHRADFGKGQIGYQMIYNLISEVGGVTDYAYIVHEINPEEFYVPFLTVDDVRQNASVEIKSMISIGIARKDLDDNFSLRYESLSTAEHKQKRNKDIKAKMHDFMKDFCTGLTSYTTTRQYHDLKS